MTFLMALSIAWRMKGLSPFIVIELFIAFSMCALAILKFRDMQGFKKQFVHYDLLAKKAPFYAHVYPFVEGLAGILMLAGVFTKLAAVGALFIGAVGLVSVTKAVYIDKKDLECACVGGDSKVPLGVISLTENIMMCLIGITMLGR